MLSVEGLSKSFGNQHILKDINLQLNDGETTVILGPSGSGKSTLLRCLNLLETPEQGTLTIEGDRLQFGGKLSDAQVRTMRQHSAMVFQQFNLFPNYTALQNVALAPTLNGKMSRSESQQLARDLLVKVGLEHRIDSYPDLLSGGQQQRVAIARALAVSPDYLLFDEPTSALDPELEAEVIRVLIDLARENRSLVVVTHNMAFAQKVANKIIFLDEGRVAFDGPADDFFASDQPRIRQFLNIFDVVSSAS